MSGRNPYQAFRAYALPLRHAVRCVCYAPLSLQEASEREITAEVVYGIALNRMAPVVLDADPSLTLRVGQQFRIVERGGRTNRFTVETVKYLYVLSTADDTEILSFHWAPDDPGGVPFPHMHVGRAVVSEHTRIRPDTFHKMHIPTGRITLPAVIRLAIVELGVRPLTPRWPTILADAEAALDS